VKGFEAAELMTRTPMPPADIIRQSEQAIIEISVLLDELARRPCSAGRGLAPDPRQLPNLLQAETLEPVKRRSRVAASRNRPETAELSV